MKKKFAIIALSCVVFYIVSFLAGLHIAFVSSFFLTRTFFVHIETMAVFYLGGSYSFDVTPTEVLHMQEVGGLMILGHSLFILFLPLAIFLVWYFKKRNVTLSKEFLYIPGIVLCVGVIASIFFTSAFTAFHKILFRNNYWLFPPDSLILQAYPHSFFIQLLLILCALFSLSVYVIYRFLKK